MNENRVLVVGAGIAGLHAACALAEAGEAVLVVDKAPVRGGNVLRQGLPGAAKLHIGQAHGRLWESLVRRLARLEKTVEIRCRTTFSGIDRTGVALVTGAGWAGEMFRPRALVIATGATENVRPRPGWTLDGVSTVGALQIGMKMTGTLPTGRVVLAGSGPLLFAAGAQMVQAGNPPFAILEEGRPFSSPWHAIGLPPSYVAEALGYLGPLVRARVPIRTGVVLHGIAQDGGRFALDYERNGKRAMLVADRVGLHDGLLRNNPGLSASPGLPARLAGDCHTGLGARAAAIDGEQAGREIAACLAGAPPPRPPAGIAFEARAQARLARLFAPGKPVAPRDIPDDTVLCRCEGKTFGDLRAIASQGRNGGGATVRTLRLSGRFGMGRCQGRYCLHWASALLAGSGSTGSLPSGTPSPEDMRGNRWPAQPVSIRALLGAEDRVSTDPPVNTRKTEV